MNEAYYLDCEQIEQMLYDDEKAASIVKGLKKSNAITLEGLIEAPDVEKWKDVLLTKYNDRTRITDAYFAGRAEKIMICAGACI